MPETKKTQRFERSGARQPELAHIKNSLVSVAIMCVLIAGLETLIPRAPSLFFDRIIYDAVGYAVANAKGRSVRSLVAGLVDLVMQSPLHMLSTNRWANEAQARLTIETRLLALVTGGYHVHALDWSAVIGPASVVKCVVLNFIYLVLDPERAFAYTAVPGAPSLVVTRLAYDLLRAPARALVRLTLANFQLYERTVYDSPCVHPDNLVAFRVADSSVPEFLAAMHNAHPTIPHPPLSQAAFRRRSTLAGLLRACFYPHQLPPTAEDAEEAADALESTMCRLRLILG